MKSLTGTVVFDALPRGDNLLIISGATEAKPVTIEYKLDAVWIKADSFTSDGVRIVFMGGCTFRVVAGTAKFAFA